MGNFKFTSVEKTLCLHINITFSTLTQEVYYAVLTLYISFAQVKGITNIDFSFDSRQNVKEEHNCLLYIQRLFFPF